MPLLRRVRLEAQRGRGVKWRRGKSPTAVVKASILSATREEGNRVRPTDPMLGLEQSLRAAPAALAAPLPSLGRHWRFCAHPQTVNDSLTAFCAVYRPRPRTAVVWTRGACALVRVGGWGGRRSPSTPRE